MPEKANSVMLVRPITINPARRSRATAAASASAGAQLLQRPRTGAGHLPLDVEQVLDRNRDAGKARRRRPCACAAGRWRRQRPSARFRVDVHERARALARGVGDAGETLLDQLARGGRAASRSAASVARVGVSGMTAGCSLCFIACCLGADSMSRSSSAELSDLPWASSASERVTPPPSACVHDEVQAPTDWAARSEPPRPRRPRRNAPSPAPPVTCSRSSG